MKDMSRMFRDSFSGRDLYVPSRRELITASNLALLREKGIDPHDVHCECCGIHLTDIGKIKFSGRVIGPECAKHPELFPCRHAKLEAKPVAVGAVSRPVSTYQRPSPLPCCQVDSSLVGGERP